MSSNTPTRRDALKVGLFATAGLAVGRWPRLHPELLAEQQQLPLITKPIPSSGERIPPIGIGTNAYNLTPELRPALRDVMKRFVELGGSVYDSATGYSGGQSESVLGELHTELGLRSKLFFVTKITAPGEDLARGRAMFDTSMQRMKTDKIDGMLVHNLTGVDALMPALQEWKQAGKIKYLGISTSSNGQYEALMGHMRKYKLDIVQVDYSIGNRDSEAVLQLAKELGVAVMANVPFGGRRGATEGLTKIQTLPAWAAEFDCKSPAQLMLKFVISHPAITVAIPGTRRVEHVEDNNGAARGRLPDEATRKRIEQFWDTLPA